MNIDWKLIFKNAMDAAVATSKTNEPAIRDYLKGVEGQHVAALETIALAYATREIDKATFESSLEDEAETVRNELLVLEVMSKATLQKAANAFLDALQSGIKAALFAAL